MTDTAVEEVVQRIEEEACEREAREPEPKPYSSGEEKVIRRMTICYQRIFSSKYESK